jgi:hypothetical protein
MEWNFYGIGGAAMGDVKCLSAAPLIRAQSVSSEYFINVVRGYEAKYQMDWLTFYTDHKDTGEESNVDFSDWMFLCKAYFGDLVATNGPPIKGCSQKPESSSGFCYLRDNMSPLARRSSSLRATNQQGTELL